MCIRFGIDQYFTRVGLVDSLVQHQKLVLKQN